MIHHVSVRKWLDAWKESKAEAADMRIDPDSVPSPQLLVEIPRVFEDEDDQEETEEDPA